MVVQVDGAFYVQRAFKRFENHDFEGGWSDFAQAIQLEPDNLIYRRERLSLTLPSRLYLLALEDLNRIIALSSDFEEVADARCKRLLCHHAFKNDKGLMVDLDWLIENGCGEARLYGLRGSIKLKWGQFEAALADCDRAHRMAPDNGTYLFDRARAYYHLGHYAEALLDLHQVLLTVFSDEASVYYWLGRVHFNLGDEEMSLVYFDRFAPYYGIEPLSTALEYMKLFAPEDID